MNSRGISRRPAAAAGSARRPRVTAVLRSAWRSLFRRRARGVAVTAAASVALTALLVALSFLLAPVDREALRRGYVESYRFFDRDGRLLRETVSESGGPARWAALEDVSPFVVAATVACEDERFYEHRGVDFAALLRAAFQNASSGQVVSGASTIDMQLARLMFRRPHSLPGKIAQIHDALRLELYLDKDTILLNYLNRSPYGRNLTGVETASECYFGKPSRALSLGEAALLAGIPQSPVRLDPVANFAEVRKRQAFVLDRMVKTGKITDAERQAALRERIAVRPPRESAGAMHFTDYVLSLKPPRGDVRTTLSGHLNAQIERIVADHVDYLAQGGLTDAACVVLDNTNGEILAMVGSADYWREKAGMVNGVLARRQPGSTLKPFLYALAFENGFSPVSVLPDVRTEYLGIDHEAYVPENHTKTFHGPVPAKEALARSLNVPAVFLTNSVGVYPLLETLRDAGLRSLDQDERHYGLGLILGNGEVTLLELAEAYSLFARDGRTMRAVAVRSTEVAVRSTEAAVRSTEAAVRPPGRAAAERGERRLFSRQTCFLVSHILSDENLRVQAFGYSNPLLLGFPMAVKTGTSSNWRDNWVIGYTDKYTIGVWAGDFRGNPMNQLSGVVGAGPLFNKIARLVVSEGPYRDRPAYPVVPEGVENVRVCKASGLTPTAACPETMTAFVVKRDEPLPPCEVHRAVRLDKRNGLLASPKCPARYVEEKVFAFLPPRYAEWQKEAGIEAPPTRYSPASPLHGVVANALVVTAPRNGEIYIIEPGYDLRTQSIRLRGEVDPPLPNVDWLVDGRKAATAAWPYTAVWRLQKGKHVVQIAAGKTASDKIYFEVR